MSCRASWPHSVVAKGSLTGVQFFFDCLWLPVFLINSKGCCFPTVRDVERLGMLLFILTLLLAAAIEAAPIVSFPLNSQVPPVARVSQPFDFQFSPGTFTAASGSLEYSLSGSPTWLSLDSPNRRLYGSPTEKDIGAPSFTIIAEDATGSTPMQATLIVSADAAPKLNVDITDSLAKAGKLSGPRSLSLQPSEQFSIQFPMDTFTSSTTADLTYYATLSDRSPLPSWVSFNPDSMVFSGTCSASSQTVDLMLVASDVRGFAGSSLVFTISVSTHQLFFSNVDQTVNVTAGSEVNIANLRNQLSLDGEALSDTDFKNATASPPSWLSFDPKTLGIRGTAPQDVNSTSFTISAADRFGDVANTTILLMAGSELFRGAVGNLNAVVGEPAKFDLSNVVTKQPGLQVEVDLGSAAQWLHFDEDSLTISGEIPSSAAPQEIHGSIKVTTADGSQSDTGSFDIVVKAAEATGSNPRSTSATANASTTAGSSETSSAGLSPHETSNNGAVIAVSVVCIVVAIIALVLGFLLYRRSGRPGRPSSPRRRKEDISRPIYHDESDWQMADDTFIGERDVEKGEGTVRRTNIPPPQIGTPSPLKRATMEKRGIRHNYRPSHATSIGENDSQVLHSAIQSGDWSVAAGAIPVSHGAGPSSRPLEDSPARGRRSRRSFRVHRDSQDSYGRRSVGLPARRRLHGIGHGRTSFGSPSRRFSSQRSRGADSYSSFSTLSTGMLSNGLLSPTASQFPAPPPSPCTTNRHSNAENRKSVRIVPGSPAADNSTILADTRPLDERRQSYIRNRALSRSPFFAAHTSSRGSSSQRPSMIGALGDSRPSGDAGEYAGRTLSPSSYYGSHPTAAGAMVSSTEERPQFPGSLRRKRTGQGRTARAYSESSSTVADTPSRWRSPNNGTIGPLTGTAPTESPRSSMILSGLSDSAYTTTEGTGTEEYSNGRSPADDEGDPMDIDDPEELRISSDLSGSSEGIATRPPAFMTSPLSPSALRVKKRQQQEHQAPSSTAPAQHSAPGIVPSSSKDEEEDDDDDSKALEDLLHRTPSPANSFKSNITHSPFHHHHHRRRRNRSTAASASAPSSPTKPPPPLPASVIPPRHHRHHRPKTSLTDLATITSRRRGGDDKDPANAAMTPPSLEDFNHAALLRNSAVATQQRRRSSAAGMGGGGGGGGIGGIGGRGVGKLGLSAAVRQQLRQRDSIINRGRHQYGSGGSRTGSVGKMGGVGGGGGGGGGGGPIVSNSGRFSNRAGRERKRRSGNGSGAGVGVGVAGGSRLSGALGQQQQREAGEALLVGRDTGVGAEAPGMMEQQERDDEVTSAHPAAASGLRIPLSMISNAGAKANFLAPSSQQQQQQPPSLCPPPPPFGSTPSSPSKKLQAGSSGSSGMYGLGSSGFRDDDHFFMGPGKARRPVSVESSPTRFSSMRGTRESVIGAAAAGAERAGAWKTGEVTPVSPGVPPLPEKSEERKTRESSVVGNEAFL